MDPIDEAEAADDMAHTRGRVRALERRGYTTDAAAAADRWAERAERFRNTALHMAIVCKLLRAYPKSSPYVDPELGRSYTLTEARKELHFQHEQHVRAREQEANWRRMAEQDAEAETSGRKPGAMEKNHG
ncbi:hypothetical protein D3869_01570 [Azospirillum brasilense]|uniref:Uncharacterized protein n=1 Tax=Azospirillum brasilense TaxID=192 RepID=A0A4D8QYH2_AZOBR|nr:hypothetical protein [Azospirillum brasilense]QCO14024.1 hypothetical protein D3869_01570 [Azospirillum brasilense]